MSVTEKYPDLNGQYQITSENNTNYNSIAWAMNNDKKNWEPHPFTGYYWPQDLEYKLTIEVLRELFMSRGYEESDNSNYETGYIKIAIYINDGQPNHVARQQKAREWTSKIDKCEKISHETPEHIESSDLCVGLGFLTSTFFKKKN